MNGKYGELVRQLRRRAESYANAVDGNFLVYDAVAVALDLAAADAIERLCRDVEESEEAARL
ncbi:hypothetical protein [Labrys wisconsinensis]|uniref:Uncharacterized protein n=1 Tax=Labrys wisconsinensis TaxID=425677 RepID=A0ABU0JHH2_9HYPH|nr:hypothetical protein [Labrys wisconsinensis]MDQ0473737.1 hypothetical protein [Labrys wisconsinensis]